MSPMRVAFVYPGYWPYVRRGVERMIHDIGSYLSGRGHDVHVFCGKPGRGRTERSDGITVHYYDWHYHPLITAYAPWWYLYYFGLATTRELMNGGFNILHLFSYSFAFAAPILQRVENVPYVFHLIMNDPGWPQGFRTWTYRNFIRCADHVAALTPKGAAAVSQQFGVGVTVLPPPVDLDTFRPQGPKQTAHPIVLFTADLADERKGGQLLLRAWNEIHRECPQARLVFAGPYGLAYDPRARGFLDAIPRQIRQPSAREAVEVLGTGTLTELPQLYAKASVTVLPSIRETFGMVVNESLASGTPVVASDDAGPGEILGDNRAVGRLVSLSQDYDLFSARQVGSLARAVLEAIELSSDPRTPEACRDHAAGWGIPVIGAQTEALYEQTIANRHP